MGTITVVNHLTLDGVTQGLGRPDEDRRGGFAYGGWGAAYADEVLGRTMAEGFGTTAGLLLGRRTYEDFYGYWPQQTDNPYTEVLDRTPKYVVSRSLAGPLPWSNSTLVSGDAGPALGRLRTEVDGSLVVLGSGALVRTLTELDLVDSYVLVINPVVLGQGRRLFADTGPRRDLTLSSSVVTTTGAIIATYAVGGRPA
jgi:dihydrofolate reductase